MEAEIQATAMKPPLDFSFRLCPITFYLDFSFRLCKVDFSLKFSFIYTFRFHIGFRMLSVSFQTGSLKNRKTSYFRLVQIGSY